MCVFFLTLIVTEQACALKVPSRISHGAVLQAMQDTWEDLGLHNNLTRSTTRCGSVWSWALNQIEPWEFGFFFRSNDGLYIYGSIWLIWINGMKTMTGLMVTMVIIWLMMVNNNLVGAWPTPLKKWWSEWKSVGMIIPFQTTNQWCSRLYLGTWP